jgi:hypothetical protein
MLPEIGKELDLVTKLFMKELLDKYDVEQHVSTKLQSIDNHKATVEKDGKSFDINFDKAFVCLGMRSFSPMMNELTDYANENDAMLLNLGDSKRARRIYEGSQEARRVINAVHAVDQRKILELRSQINKTEL